MSCSARPLAETVSDCFALRGFPQRAFLIVLLCGASTRESFHSVEKTPPWPQGMCHVFRAIWYLDMCQVCAWVSRRFCIFEACVGHVSGSSSSSSGGGGCGSSSSNMSGHVPYMWLGGVLAILAVVVV